MDESVVKREQVRAVVLPLVLLGGLVGLLVWQVQRLVDTAAWVDHTDAVIAQANQVKGLALDLETGLRGYLLAGQRSFLAPHEGALTELGGALEALRALVGGKPPQQRRIDRVKGLLRGWLGFAAKVRRLRDRGRDVRGYVAAGRGKHVMDAIRGELVAFVRHEASLREVRSRAAEHEVRRTLGSTVGLGVLAVAVLAGFTRRRLRLVASEFGRAMAATARDARRLAGLHALDRAILAADAPREVARAALGRLRGVVAFDEAFTAVLDEAGGYLVTASALDDGADVQLSEQPMTPAVGSALAGIPGHDAAGEIQGTLAEGVLQAPARSTLGVALMAEQRLLGYLGVAGRRPAAFGDDDAQILVEVADQLAIAIRHRAMRAEIARRAAELEDRVADRTRALEEANAELEAFARTVSHDLRAPLRAMEGFAAALREEYGAQLDATAADYLHRIAGAGRRMDALITDLLEFSRLSRVDLSLARVALDPLVRAVVGDVVAPGTADVRIQTALPDVAAHEPTLHQVVSNLVENAIKFVAAGVRPVIRVWAEHRGAAVRIWVEDNGIGVAPEHHARIFQVFERLHGTEAYPGTGIGLAIVRKATERMGGRCGVESAPGAGSRFWIELPEVSR